MRKTVFTAMLCFAFDGMSQTPAKEPDGLHSLLVEVHQLRQDIEAMTVTSQRVQIALSSLQIQDAAVARAAQRLDDARNKCSGAEANRGRTATTIQRLESELSSGTLVETKTKEYQSLLTQMKGEIEARTAEVQTCQAVEADASSQLRNDQAKLVDLQDRIERLDKTLEKLGGGAK
jgi:chromosome segregation ATPase